MFVTKIKIQDTEIKDKKKDSDTGNRTRASWVKARYPSH
jgi:hypothetical protein